LVSDISDLFVVIHPQGTASFGWVEASNNLCGKHAYDFYIHIYIYIYIPFDVSFVKTETSISMTFEGTLLRSSELRAEQAEEATAGRGEGGVAEDHCSMS